MRYKPLELQDPFVKKETGRSGGFCGGHPQGAEAPPSCMEGGDKGEGGRRAWTTKHAQLNSAYLMKLSWSLDMESTACWAKVLKGKYCKEGDLEAPMAVRNSSNAWRGILETQDLITKGMGHIIGDGRHTKIWLHRWLNGSALLPQALREVPEDQKIA